MEALTDTQKIAALRFAQQVLQAVERTASAVGLLAQIVRGTLWLTGIAVMADRLERDCKSTLEALKLIEQEYVG